MFFIYVAIIVDMKKKLLSKVFLGVLLFNIVIIGNLAFADHCGNSDPDDVFFSNKFSSKT